MNSFEPQTTGSIRCINCGMYIDYEPAHYFNDGVYCSSCIRYTGCSGKQYGFGDEDYSDLLKEANKKLDGLA